MDRCMAWAHRELRRQTSKAKPQPGQPLALVKPAQIQLSQLLVRGCEAMWPMGAGLRYIPPRPKAIYGRVEEKSPCIHFLTPMQEQGDVVCCIGVQQFHGSQIRFIS